MGMGATNTLDRVAAMMGEIREVPIAFQAAVDVPYGGANPCHKRWRTMHGYRAFR
jgi:hypothetical protein